MWKDLLSIHVCLIFYIFPCSLPGYLNIVRSLRSGICLSLQPSVHLSASPSLVCPSICPHVSILPHLCPSSYLLSFYPPYRLACLSLYLSDCHGIETTCNNETDKNPIESLCDPYT